MEIVILDRGTTNGKTKTQSNIVVGSVCAAVNDLVNPF
jgi:hypothetical protein